MSEPAYQVFGSGRPALLGRAAEVASVRRHWHNTSINVIGPKFYGKTAVLRHLSALAGEDGFDDVVYWNVREPVPETRAQFFELLHGHMSRQAKNASAMLGSPKEEDGHYQEIKDAVEEMQKDEMRLLIIMQSVDGLLLRGDNISPNLWDNLAHFAGQCGVRFVLSSRKKLIDLVPSESAKLSDFWRKFGHIEPLGAFDERDWDAVVSPFAARGIALDASARKELVNWTGGIPPLAIGLCAKLNDHPDGVKIGKAEVDGAAKALDRRNLDELWKDIPADVQDRLGELSQKKSLPRSQCEMALADELHARALAKDESGHFKPTSRLLIEHAERVSSAMPEMRRLFGNADDYLENVRRLLELRVAQAAGWHPEIKAHFNAILQQLDTPDAATQMLRGIYDRCADLIIKLDFPDGRIPEEWIKDWDSRGKLGNEDPRRTRPESRDIDEMRRGRVPTHRGPRMKLLRLLRDDEICGQSKARSSTLCLLDGLLSASNHCSHAYEVGEAVPLSFACAALFSALELCGQLSQDQRK